MSTKWIFRLAAGAVLAVALGPCASAAAGGSGVLHVDDDAAPGGNGASWATPVALLQDALDTARAGDVTEVRVAGGIYVTDRGEGVLTGDRETTFDIPSGVAVRGGFAGLAGGDPDVRDVSRFVTILSGDLAQDDSARGGGPDENAYHVVTLLDVTKSTMLDGVVVRGGQADADPPHDVGGGLRIQGGAPVLVDVLVEGNRAVVGGGGHETSSAAVYQRVIFQANTATIGGGLYGQGSVARCEDCAFIDNAAVNGAGLYDDVSARIVDRGLFLCNDALFEGGGVSAVGGGPQFLGTSFHDNIAGSAGGGLAAAAADLVLDDVKFRANSAVRGGGVRMVGGEPILQATTFQMNTAERGGGASLAFSQSTLDACVFLTNMAVEAAAIALESDASVLTGCVLRANIAEETGGGFLSAGGTPVFLGGVIEANVSGRNGGGGHIEGGIVTTDGLVLRDNFVQRGFVSNGGGLSIVSDGELLASETGFLENEAKFGGGLFVSGASVTLSACTFAGNTALTGGGVHAIDGDLIVTGGVWSANRSGDSPLSFGGAFYARDTTGMLDGVTIEHNQAVLGGGGVFWENGTVELRDATVSGNSSGGSGGGVSIRTAEAALLRSTIAGNTAAQGGGLAMLLGSTRLEDTVFLGNRAVGSKSIQARGGAVWNIVSQMEARGLSVYANEAIGGAGGGLAGASGIVANSILWGNVDGDGRGESAQVQGDAVVRASIVEGLTGKLGGEGNIGDEPIFEDAVGADEIAGTLDDDLRLAAGSPGIDAGDNAEVAGTLDRLGAPRRIDDPAVIDTGFGEAPVVDMGAFERVPTCHADIDGDGVVGFLDLVMLLSAWGACPAACAPDLDDSGQVNFLDLLQVLAAWGPC